MSYLLPVYILLVATLALYGYNDIRRKPKVASKFLWSYDMKNAKVTLSWVKSVSSDVVNQVVVVAVNGVDIFLANLAPDVQSVEIGTFAQGSVLTGTHTVADGSGNTAVANLPSFTVPDLESPVPATGFSWSYVVVETNDDQNVDPGDLTGPLH